jgi:acetamidase/formamidase
VSDFSRTNHSIHNPKSPTVQQAKGIDNYFVSIRRHHRNALCSLAADLHVTQAVDQTKGVHATIAKSLSK